MKKILVVLSILAGVLTGCVGGSDSEYISTVKEISFNNGKTVENVVKEKLIGARFQELYGENELLSNMGVIILLSTVDYGVTNDLRKLKKLLEQQNIVPITIEDKDIKWEVEGETKRGKTIKAFTEKEIVKISTEQDGDYIKLNYDDINVFTKKDGKLLKSNNTEGNDQLNTTLINFYKKVN